MVGPQPVICVLGLGNMGIALAKCVLNNGHPLVVWNRTASQAKSLIGLGANVAGTVSDAVKKSDVIIVNLLSYEVSDGLLRNAEVENVVSGKTVIQTCTGTPKNAHRSAEWAATHAVHYLDGAIMATADTVGDPEALFFYSGKRDVFKQNEPLLRQFGGNIVYSGESAGGAAAFDLGLLSYLFGSGTAYLHGLALARSENIPAKEFAKMTNHLVKTLIPAGFEYQADMLNKGDYTNTPSSVAAINSAAETITRFSEENGIDAAIPALVLKYSEKVIDAGYAEQDFAVLADLLRSQQTTGIK